MAVVPAVARSVLGLSYSAEVSFFAGDCLNYSGIAPGLSRLE
jgi:hypothetical protein